MALAAIIGLTISTTSALVAIIATLLRPDVGSAVGALLLASVLFFGSLTGLAFTVRAVRQT